MPNRLTCVQILERSSTGRRGPGGGSSGTKKLTSQLSVDIPLDVIMEEDDEVLNCYFPKNDKHHTTIEFKCMVLI